MLSFLPVPPADHLRREDPAAESSPAVVAAMEKFGMSFGGGPSRKDLMDTVESQRKQLLQYQSRFKDVVQAYKSLLKEKEALEASLKVLTVSQEVEVEVEVQDRTGEDNAAVSQVPEESCTFHSEDSLDAASSVETPCDTTRGQQDKELQRQEVQAEVREFKTILLVLIINELLIISLHV